MKTKEEIVDAIRLCREGIDLSNLPFGKKTELVGIVAALCWVIDAPVRESGITFDEIMQIVRAKLGHESRNSRQQGGQESPDGHDRLHAGRGGGGG